MNKIESSAPWLHPWWRELPRRWGHPWHSMCSYLAMFPPALPRYFIEQCSRPGDTVLDPFSGRGTVPLEACLAGRIGVGTDLNPLAVALTGAKVDPPSLQLIRKRLADLQSLYEKGRIKVQAPPEIRMLFDGRRTLPQLYFLRETLDFDDQTDRYLLAVLCGILHGNHLSKPEKSRTLSISMPNTFSMSPGYIKKYIRKNRLKKYPFDVFDLLDYRIGYLHRSESPKTIGKCEKVDARKISGYLEDGQVSLILSSPPYLKLIRYGKYNWIRLWLLKELDDTGNLVSDIEHIDKRLHLSDQLCLLDYLKFMKECLTSWEALVKPGGICVLVIGDVEQKGVSINLAEEVWQHVKETTAFKLITILQDDLVTSNKVTRIWGGKKGQATKVDRLLILKMPGSPKYRAKLPNTVLRCMRQVA